MTTDDVSVDCRSTWSCIARMLPVTIALWAGAVAQPMPPIIQWTLIPGGTLLMGSTTGQKDEQPVHEVRIRSFWMSATEVTFEQYDAFCEATRREKPDDEGWGRGMLPVVNVSHEDAVAFCTWLSGQTGDRIRLPTEAEWEFAARSGGGESLPYAGGASLFEVAWFAGNSEEQSHAARTRRPNALGLFDMTGNVSEWCADWYSAEYYRQSPPENPVGPVTGSNRVIRGGSWRTTEPQALRVTARAAAPSEVWSPAVGFRITRAL